MQPPLGGQIAQILGSNFASDAHWEAAGELSMD
jgi:hypothetical protein